MLSQRFGSEPNKLLRQFVVSRNVSFVNFLVCFMCSVESDWAGLVNGMSGLVCAHLNAITTKSSYHPAHSFRPQGTIVGESVQGGKRAVSC